MGEGTHGSSEFFSMKDKIFRRLVLEKSFDEMRSKFNGNTCDKHRADMYERQSFGETRDSLMAVYSAWWQQILPGDAQVALWAHNLHVMDNTNPGPMWMGIFLRQELVEDYKNIGLIFTLGGLNAFYTSGNGSFHNSVREQEVLNQRCNTTNALYYDLPYDRFYYIFKDIHCPSESFSYFDPHKIFIKWVLALIRAIYRITRQVYLFSNTGIAGYILIQ